MNNASSTPSVPGRNQALSGGPAMAAASPVTAVPKFSGAPRGDRIRMTSVRILQPRGGVRIVMGKLARFFGTTLAA